MIVVNSKPHDIVEQNPERVLETIKMQKNIFNAYDLPVDQLVDFYRKLNETIVYPDGMVTTLGIIYWGREKHLPELEQAVPRLKSAGISRFSELLEALRTQGKMRKYAQGSGISGDLLRVLKHDIELWLPKPVPLAELEPIQKYAACWEALAGLGIHDQLQMLTVGQTPHSRQALSAQSGIPGDIVKEIVRCCDMYRTGANLKHIRTRIYYDMGLDSQQKWADSTSEEIIARFSAYIQQPGVEAMRLVPWPKEVRNGIEWARLHQSVFRIAWES